LRQNSNFKTASVCLHPSPPAAAPVFKTLRVNYVSKLLQPSPHNHKAIYFHTDVIQTFFVYTNIEVNILWIIFFFWTMHKLELKIKKLVYPLITLNCNLDSLQWFFFFCIFHSVHYDSTVKTWPTNARNSTQTPTCFGPNWPIIRQCTVAQNNRPTLLSFPAGRNVASSSLHEYRGGYVQSNWNSL